MIDEHGRVCETIKAYSYKPEAEPTGDPAAELVGLARSYMSDHPGTDFQTALHQVQLKPEGQRLMAAYNVATMPVRRDRQPTAHHGAAPLETADQLVHRRALDEQRKNPSLEYGPAVRLVLNKDQTLARAYADQCASRVAK